MGDTDRTFAQGSLGEQALTAKAKPSLVTRARYHVENSLTSSNRFGLVLILASLLVAGVMTLIKLGITAVEFLNVDLSAEPDAFEQYWASLATILTLGGDPTWGARIIGVLNWVIAIAISATVIGFITAKITGIMARLGAGGSPVIESGHTLILGWSPRVFPIIRELAIAKASERRPTVVLFSELDRTTVLEELGRRVGKLGKLRLVVRTGKPTVPADLRRANVGGAASIIVLDQNDNADATTISTVLAIKAAVGDNHPPVVAEIDDPHIAETLQLTSKQAIRAVRSQDIIARMTAQASRQPGLAAVLLDLIDFDGNEIYFAAAPQLVGKTYRDALGAFATSSVIGVVDPGTGLHLNPALGMKIPPDARIVVVAEDDSTAVYSPVTLEAGKFTPAKRETATEPDHFLVIGWSSMGRAVMEAMAEFLPKGSTVHIVARSAFVDPESLANLDLGHVKVTHTATSGRMVDLLAAAEARHYDAVLVLGYRQGIEPTEADAQTMLTMLHMNALFADSNNQVHPTRLVAEVLDSTMVELAQVAAVDDLVVSDVLAALVIAQISENPQLSEVLTDLFDAQGAQIEMDPIERYAKVGETVSFGTLVARAAAQGASAFGYRSAALAKTSQSRGVELNPAKAKTFNAAPGDSLVVVRD